jgi:hypothetical protein
MSAEDLSDLARAYEQALESPSSEAAERVERRLLLAARELRRSAQTAPAPDRDLRNFGRTAAWVPRSRD